MAPSLLALFSLFKADQGTGSCSPRATPRTLPAAQASRGGLRPPSFAPAAGVATVFWGILDLRQFPALFPWLCLQMLWLQPRANAPTGARRHTLLEEGLGRQESHRVTLTCGWRIQEQVSFLSQKESRLSISSQEHFLKKPNTDHQQDPRGVGEAHGCNPQRDPPVLILAGQNWG